MVPRGETNPVNPDQDRGVADPAAAHDADALRVEAELVSRLQQGGPADREAWTELVHRHQRSVYLTCLRYTNNPDDAAELAQDTFVQVIRHIGSFDSRAKLSTWITRIAINLCLSHRRSQRLRKHQPLSEEAGSGARKSIDDRVLRNVASGGSSDKNAVTSLSDGSGGVRAAGELSAGGELSAHERVEEQERNTALFAALADLNAEQRALLILRDVQGLEYEQIAEVLGVALGTVKSRLFRARFALREAFVRRTGDGSNR